MGVQQTLVRMRQEVSQFLIRLLVGILALFVSSSLTAYIINQANLVAMPSFLWLHWSVGTIVGLIAICWMVMTIVSKRWHAGFVRALKSGSFWYWAITIGIFYFALAWAVTSWPPTGLIGWLGWVAAVLVCIAVVIVWVVVGFDRWQTEDDLVF